MQGCSDRRVAPGIRRTRAAAAGASSWGTSATPTPATRRAHRTGPGTGHAALPGRCRPWATRTKVRGPPPAVPAQPTSARAGDWQCRLARTVQDAGDSDWSPRRAGANGPPPSPARAGDWHCRPARSVQDAGDSDRGRRLRALHPQRRVGDPPSSPARAGAGTAAPLGRCKMQVTRIAVGDCGPAALISPGPGPALPPRPDGAPANGWPAAGRLGRGPGGRAVQAPPHGLGQQARLSAQPCGPSVDGATRRPQREAADV